MWIEPIATNLNLSVLDSVIWNFSGYNFHFLNYNTEMAFNGNNLNPRFCATAIADYWSGDKSQIKLTKGKFFFVLGTFL